MYHGVEACDTAQHTLVECPAWSEQRWALTGVVGGHLSLPVLVTRMAHSEEAWRAVVAYCEEAMLLKESAERIRRPEAAAAEAAAAIADSDEEKGSEEENNGGGAPTSPSPPVPIRSAHEGDPIPPLGR